MTRLAVPMLAFAIAIVLASTAFAAPLDFGRQTNMLLPPGQSGALPPVDNSLDQLPLYDALTPLFGDVRPRHVKRLFRSARFFEPQAGTVERPRRGLTIRRDRQWGVPHIRGRTRSDVFFGIGWATAEDRGVFMETIRYPARFAILDAPGRNALDLATSLRSFEPSARTERFIARQRQLVLRYGKRGRRVLEDVQAYVNGINAYNRNAGQRHQALDLYRRHRRDGDHRADLRRRWRRRGAQLATARRAAPAARRSRHRRLARPARGERSRDLRDHEATLPLRHRPAPEGPRARFVVDPGSSSASAARAARVTQQGRARASNAVLVGPRALGHRAPARRDGAAARLLLPAAVPRGGRPRRRASTSAVARFPACPMC